MKIRLQIAYYKYMKKLNLTVYIKQVIAKFGYGAFFGRMILFVQIELTWLMYI